MCFLSNAAVDDDVGSGTESVPRRLDEEYNCVVVEVTSRKDFRIADGLKEHTGRILEDIKKGRYEWRIF